MTHYACDPDCNERANCEDVGNLGHFACGRCAECGEPRHHGCLNACHTDAKEQQP
jgi:hypothetical protein